MTSKRLHKLHLNVLSAPRPPATLLSRHVCLFQQCQLQAVLPTTVFRRRFSHQAPHSVVSQSATAVPPAVGRQPADDGDTAARVQSLRSALQRYSDSYYNDGNSAVTDEQYDTLKAQLNSLEATHPTLRTHDSPTQSIGASPPTSAASRLVHHRFPMLSLDSTNDPSVLAAFVSSFQSQQPQPFVVELKYDGMALSLLYRRGGLVRAVTRGDGRRGEDVTAAFTRRVDNAPLQLASLDPAQLNSSQPNTTLAHLGADDTRRVAEMVDSEFEVRGEIVLSKAEYDRYTASTAAATAKSSESAVTDAPIARSPRNLAVGLMRRLREDDVSGGVPLPQLQFVGYSLHLPVDQQQDVPAPNNVDNNHNPPSSSLFEKQSGRLRVLERLGFTVSSHISQHTDPSTVLQAFDAIASERGSLPYDIDGVVVKLDHLPTARSLANTNTAPRWAMACKFKPATAITRVNGVKWGVGRSGRLVPVAELEPVLVGGVEVSRVALHGERWRSALRVRGGVRVEIERRGDVTPYISRVVDESAAQELLTLNVCPCERRTQLHRSDDGELYCWAVDCPSQLLAQVLNYVSRPAIDSNALGQSTAELLISLHLLTSLRDLPLLCVEPNLSRARNILLQQPGWGEKRVRRLFSSLQSAHREAEDVQLLTAAGLDGFGAVMCRRLLDEVGSIERLTAVTDTQLTLVGNLSADRWNSLRAQLHERAELLHTMQAVRQQLRGQQSGVVVDQQPGHTPTQTIADQSTTHTPQPLRGMSIVLTGAFSITRRQLIKRIRVAGGQVMSSVSKQTSYVVAGDVNYENAELEGKSHKLHEAERLKVQVIGEEQLNVMLNLQ